MDFDEYINNYNIKINNGFDDIIEGLLISMRKTDLFFLNFFKKYSPTIDKTLLEIIILIEISYYTLNLFLTLSNIPMN